MGYHSDVYDKIFKLLCLNNNVRKNSNCIYIMDELLKISIEDEYNKSLSEINIPLELIHMIVKFANYQLAKTFYYVNKEFREYVKDYNIALFIETRQFNDWLHYVTDFNILYHIPHKTYFRCDRNFSYYYCNENDLIYTRNETKYIKSKSLFKGKSYDGRIYFNNICQIKMFKHINDAKQYIKNIANILHEKNLNIALQKNNELHEDNIKFIKNLKF